MCHPSPVLLSTIGPTPKSRTRSLSRSRHVLLRWICFSHPPHRFQTDFAVLSEWLIGASKLLKTWSNLANTSDLNQECIHNHLVKMLVRLFCLFSAFMYH